MNLKELARVAMDAVAKEQKKDTDPFLVTDNGDGTVSLSVLVKFDPEVRAQKAAAMAKGVKREDLADDIPTEEGDGGESEAAVDEALPVKGVFEAALDELSGVADAATRKSRHGKTPIENCRAKDPMFCPYHGQQAIKKAVEDELKKAGQTNFTVDVTPQGSGFLVNVTVPPNSTYQNLTGPVQEAFMSGSNLKTGIKLAPPKPANIATVYGYGLNETHGQNNDTATTIVTADPLPAMENDTAKLDEWIDDLVADIADDPTLMKELDRQDLQDLLKSRDQLDDVVNAGAKPTDQSYKQALQDSRDQYLLTRAQVDYRKIQTPTDAKKVEDDIDREYLKCKKEYRDIKDPVDMAKMGVFRNRRIPNGFAKTHKWAADYNDQSASLGFFIPKEFDEARLKGMNAAPGNLKVRRFAIAGTEYALERMAAGIKPFEEAAQKYLEGLYDFADGEVKAGRMSQAQMQAAFPNGKPSAKTAAKQPATSQPAASGSAYAAVAAPAALQRRIKASAVPAINNDPNWMTKVHTFSSKRSTAAGFDSWKFNGASKAINGELFYQVEYTTTAGRVFDGGWIAPTAHIGDNAVVLDNARVGGRAYVVDEAVVSGNAIVAEDAVVMGEAMVSINAAVDGNALVDDRSRVTDNATVRGQAVVEETATVGGFAKVEDAARISGNAVVDGDAKVKGSALITWNARVTDRATVKDNSEVEGYAIVRGDAEIQGKSIIKGKAEIDDNAVVRDSAITQNAVVDNNAVVENSRISGQTHIAGNAVVQNKTYNTGTFL